MTEDFKKLKVEKEVFINLSIQKSLITLLLCIRHWETLRLQAIE